MTLVFVNIYPVDTFARYLISSYVLQSYLQKTFSPDSLAMKVLNFSSDTENNNIILEINNSRPDYVAYSCYIWNIEKILQIVSALKGNQQYKHILGGPEISLSMIRRTQAAPADYYVLGEGEKRLERLMRYVMHNNGASLPPGVAVWNAGDIQYVPDKERITALDEIPSIYLNGILDDRLYARQQAYLETQRGCRYHCKYCVYHKNLSGITYHSLERVSAELDHLIIKKGVLALRILDALFTSDLDRAKQIVRHLIQIKNQGCIRLPFIYWEFNYDSVDEEFLGLAASLKTRERIANLDMIEALDRPQLYGDMVKDYTCINCVGLQSLNADSLKAIGRAPIDYQELRCFMDRVRKYNVVLKIDLILGLPFETYGSYFAGLDQVMAALRDTDHVLNIHRLQILPGSELEEQCAAYGVNYSAEAPHLVLATRHCEAGDMDYASRLTAIIFRVFNSPLRRKFFEYRELSGQTFEQIAAGILERVRSEERFRYTALVRNAAPDDIYWNGAVYGDLPSQWLWDYFNQSR